jgi:hypothetical protein
MCAGIDRCNIYGATGLKEDPIAGIAESGDEWEAVRLYKRFPSCDFHERAPIILHLCHDLIDRTLLPSVERIVCITPGAAERASGQSYKYTGLPSVA